MSQRLVIVRLGGLFSLCFVSLAACRSTAQHQEDSSTEELVQLADQEIAEHLALEGYSSPVEDPVDYSISDYRAFDPRGIVIPFAFDEAVLQPKAIVALDRIVRGMKKDPLSQITVQGHSDKQGPQIHNVRLSALRAKVIADYLISHGIETDRIEKVALGSKVPIAEGNTVRVFKKNRRGEFQLSYGRNVFGK